MSYEYIDSNGDSLWVKSFTEGEILVRVKHYTGNGAGIGVPNEDAPAVALAILEAAGIEKAGGPYFANCAAQALADHVEWQSKQKAKQAEREAEDAKVAAYRKIADPKNLWDWDTLGDATKNTWREMYRAAREFFAKEDAPAPRVLQYGDPEPDHGTKWEDPDGDIWEWYAGGGGWRTRAAWWPWEKITPGVFPMTEVTGDASR